MADESAYKPPLGPVLIERRSFRVLCFDHFGFGEGDRSELISLRFPAEVEAGHTAHEIAIAMWNMELLLMQSINSHSQFCWHFEWSHIEGGVWPLGVGMCGAWSHPHEPNDVAAEARWPFLHIAEAYRTVQDFHTSTSGSVSKPLVDNRLIERLWGPS